MSAMLLPSLCACGGDASSPAGEQAMVGSQESEPDEAPLVPLLTVPGCLELGGSPVGLTGVPGMGVYLGDPMVDSTRDDVCPAMRRKIGTLESSFDPNGGLCCEVPPLMTAEDCEGVGGVAMADPGGGGTFYLGCDGVSTELVGTVVGWLICERPATFCKEGGICCRP
jgi:hypothetical protein